MVEERVVLGPEPALSQLPLQPGAPLPPAELWFQPPGPGGGVMGTPAAGPAWPGRAQDTQQDWIPRASAWHSSSLSEPRAPPGRARPPGRPESSLSRQPWSRTCSPGLL